MDLDESHAVFQLEFEVPVVHHVALLGHQVGDEFEVLRGTGSGIVTVDGHLGFGE